MFIIYGIETRVWHKNGKKAATMRGENPQSLEMKFWNDKGEEIDQEEGEKMLDKMQNEIVEDDKEFEKRLEPKPNQNNP